MCRLEIVDDEEEENSSVSRHRMFEHKTRTVSSTMLIGKRNLNMYIRVPGTDGELT